MSDLVVRQFFDARQVSRLRRPLRPMLPPAQEAAAIFRRKVIYEELHPETKHGGDRRSESARENQNDNLSFCSATSDATGKDKRSIERAAARAEALGDDLSAIAGTSLDKGVEFFGCHRRLVLRATL